MTTQSEARESLWTIVCDNFGWVTRSDTARVKFVDDLKRLVSE